MYPPLQPPHNTPQTGQAQRVLTWLDRWLPGLVDRNCYRQLRHSFGPPARGAARLGPGGPRLGGVRLPVSGSGDEAHGHSRLERIVAELLIPAIEAGQIPQERIGETLQRLRGEFAYLHRRVEAARSKISRG